jgi:hypothetical protein
VETVNWYSPGTVASQSTRPSVLTWPFWTSGLAPGARLNTPTVSGKSGDVVVATAVQTMPGMTVTV